MGSATSSAMGASTSSWTKTEQQQMINIHHVWKQCFPPPITSWIEDESKMAKVKTAAETPEETSLTDVIVAGKHSEDHEEFFAPDSLLRTIDGKHKVPKNPPFISFEAFKESCKFQHWRAHFESLSYDPILTLAAKTIVSHICMLQSRKQLHYRHGSVPGGFFLRKKREQIVPLTLFLHELKLWATNELRTLNPYEKKSSITLDRRVKYAEMMESEDIWVSKARLFTRGMKEESSHTLFLVLLDIKEQIMRCRDYCKKCHGSKGNIEKLQNLSDSLRQLVLHESVLVSSMFEARDRLTKPSTGQFSPLDLLNSPRAQHFVDYENIANICLFRLLRKPLAQAALLADFESVSNPMERLGEWRYQNPFTEDGTPRLEVSGFGSGYLPKIYSEVADEITNYLRDVDPEASVPLTAETQVKNLKTNLKEGDDLKNVMQKFLQFMGAIYEFFPIIIVINEFSQVGKHGGNYTVYESLAEQMKTIVQRSGQLVKTAQQKERELVAAFSKCAATVERSMEEERIKTRSAPKPPTWVENLASVKRSTLLLTRDNFKRCYELVQEISGDIGGYDMSADQLNDKIKYVRSLCNVLETTMKSPTGKESKEPSQTPQGDSPSEVRQIVG